MEWMQLLAIDLDKNWIDLEIGTWQVKWLENCQVDQNKYSILNSKEFEFTQAIYPSLYQPCN